MKQQSCRMMEARILRGSAMKPQQTTITLDTLYANRQSQFWILQISGWFGVAVITFLTFTVWNSTVAPSHFFHAIIQSILGVLITWPLRSLLTFIWTMSIVQRVILSLVAVAVVAAIWTSARMVTFMWMSGETGLFEEFNDWYYGGLFIILCWVALYYCAKHYRLLQQQHLKTLAAAAEAQTEMYKRLQAEAVAKEAQLKMLRYQLNPHFLFNTLNSIYALIQFEDPATAKQMVKQLSTFLRYSLDTDPLHPIGLATEMEAITLYLNIEKVRFAERLNLDFNISEQAKYAKIPSLLLQPLIENSLKFAILPNEDGGTLGVRAYVKEQNLCIEVWDNGPGASITEDDIINGQGVGLKNTLDRLRTLYENNHKFDLLPSDPHGLTIRIQFPYESLVS